MKTEDQITSECMPAETGDRKDQVGVPSGLTRKQIKLANFIAEEFVAKFEAVVLAIKNRQYNQVDQWKAEARIRAATPPTLDPTIAECITRQKARLEGR